MTAPVQFTSVLGPVIKRYLDLKRALGRRADSLQYMLAQFDRFLAFYNARDLNQAIFTSWGCSIANLATNTRRQRMRVIYHLCLFRRRYEPSCFVPDPNQFPSLQPRPLPHIFSEGEITQLLLATDALKPSAPSPLQRPVARIAITFLYTAGLRRGELARLTLSDYDTAEHVLLIRESKFYKSRLVPLSADAVAEIGRYLEQRLNPGFPRGADAPLLLHHHGALTGYTGVGLGALVRKVIRTTGIRTGAGRPPRVHDLRFTFAVHALLRWYRAGVDVQARLPALSTYMGHSSLVSTQYYLVFFDAIAQAASERFDAQCAEFLSAVSLQGGDL
jgi:integrase/recombinase XerD